MLHPHVHTTFAERLRSTVSIALADSEATRLAPMSPSNPFHYPYRNGKEEQFIGVLLNKHKGKWMIGFHKNKNVKRK